MTDGVSFLVWVSRAHISGLQDLHRYNESLVLLCRAVSQLTELGLELVMQLGSINTGTHFVIVFSFKCHHICSSFRSKRNSGSSKKSLCSLCFHFQQQQSEWRTHTDFANTWSQSVCELLLQTCHLKNVHIWLDKVAAGVDGWRC